MQKINECVYVVQMQNRLHAQAYFMLKLAYTDKLGLVAENLPCR